MWTLSLFGNEAKITTLVRVDLSSIGRYVMVKIIKLVHVDLSNLAKITTLVSVHPS